MYREKEPINTFICYINIIQCIFLEKKKIKKSVILVIMQRTRGALKLKNSLSYEEKDP